MQAKRLAASLSSRQQVLLTHPRWAQVPRIIGWHRAPLTAADGCSPMEIAAIEERIGLRLPQAVREWFELLGHRLRMVQDIPATPESIQAEGKRVHLWSENQGAWVLWAGPGDDPMGEVEGEAYDAPISAFLVSMLISETLVGAWSDTRQGPLGELAPQVCGGGMLDDVTEAEIDSLQNRYQRCEWPLPMSWATWYGDDETIIRISDGDFVEWLTTTPEALARIGESLNRDTGRFRLVMRIVDFVDTQRDRLQEGGQCLDTVRLFGGVEKEKDVMKLACYVSTMLSSKPPVAEIQFDTDAPEALSAVIVAALASTWGYRLSVAWRPERGGPFTLGYPLLGDG